MPSDKRQAAAIAEQMAGLAAKTEAGSDPSGRPAVRPMPAQAPKPVTYEKRIPFTTTTEQFDALVAARGRDGLPATARLRALVQLWMDDERLRDRADRLARSYR